MDDAARLRNAHLRVTDEHERHVIRGVTRAPPLVVLEELARSLAYADPAHIEKVRAVDAVLLAEPRGVHSGGHRCPRRRSRSRRARSGSGARPCAAPPRCCTRWPADRGTPACTRRADRGLLVCGRHEHRALRHQWEPEDRRVIDVGEEEHVVVVPAALEQVIEEFRHTALRVDEGALVSSVCARAECAALVQLEVPRARPLHRKAAHGHASTSSRPAVRSPFHVR